jgi:hypothetical protein
MRAKSRRNDNLLTVCLSLREKINKKKFHENIKVYIKHSSADFSVSKYFGAGFQTVGYYSAYGLEQLGLLWSYG